MNNNKSRDIEKLVEDMVNDRIPNNVTIYLDLETLSEVFTKKRMGLIKKIDETNPQSIQELAEKLDRKKQAVHRDLKLLEGHGIVELKKQGKNVIPVISKELIYIPIKQGKFNKISNVKELVRNIKIKPKEENIANTLNAEVYIGDINVNDMMKEVVG